MKILYTLLWGLLILSVMRTTILVRRRDTADFASVDESATLAILIVGLLLIALLINPRTKRVLADIRRSSPSVLLFYFILAVFSGLWAVAPAFSVFRALEVMVVFLTAYVLLSRHVDFAEAERTMLRILLLVTILSFLQRILNVGISIEGLHTNVYTVTAGMGLLYCFGESFRAEATRRKSMRRWSVIFLIFLAVGTSVGSNISVVVGLVVMLMLLGVGRVILLPLGILLVTMLVFAGTMDDLLTRTIFAGRDIEQLSNLTGRNYLWSAYLSAYADRPVLGYGFAVGPRIGDAFGTRATTNAHNGLIEAALGMGTVGLIVLLLYILTLFRELFFARRMRMPGSIGLIGAMAMVMINNNSKSILGGAYDPVAVGIFVMLAFAHYYVYRQARHHLWLKKQSVTSNGTKPATQTM